MCQSCVRLVVVCHCAHLSHWAALSDVLDRVVTYIDPVFFVGDFNVHLDRAVKAVHRWSALSRDDHGGVLDVVADLQSPSVDVSVGPSVAPVFRPRAVYSSTTRRSWRRHDEAAFHEQLLSLCQPSTTSTDSLGCTMRKLQRLSTISISSYPLRLSGVIVVRRIHALTRIVGWQSVKLGDCSGSTSRPK